MGAARDTRQLPVPLAYLLRCSATGLQRPGQLLTELLLLLSEARHLLLQVYVNHNPVSKVNYAATQSCAEHVTDLTAAGTGRPSDE